MSVVRLAEGASGCGTWYRIRAVPATTYEWKHSLLIPNVGVSDWLMAALRGNFDAITLLWRRVHIQQIIRSSDSTDGIDTSLYPAGVPETPALAPWGRQELTANGPCAA
ncbi:hypothetical protein Bbelb_430580 [Branchiostoma belcheri]|nr:hypothetical protein Bbelb_439280 [Branchiostoma belcheri]KAI8479194.1 hypothetical protein Bbelb_430580 [Branchiostoma belcheri]